MVCIDATLVYDDTRALHVLVSLLTYLKNIILSADKNRSIFQWHTIDFFPTKIESLIKESYLIRLIGL